MNLFNLAYPMSYANVAIGPQLARMNDEDIIATTTAGSSLECNDGGFEDVADQTNNS